MRRLLGPAYAAGGRLFRILWRAGLVHPGGNPWHPERDGDHADRPTRPLWLHAASLGEVQVAQAYIDRLRAVRPLYLTVQTEAGRSQAERELPDTPVAYAPLDLPGAVRRFLSRVRPSGLVIFETEIWPHWLEAFEGPIWFANARLSARSFRRYRHVRAALVPLWRNVQRVFAQSAADRDRFRALGVSASRVEVTGQVKQLQMRPAPDPALRAAWRRRLGLGDPELLWVCGSARSDEFATMIRIWQSAAARGTTATLVLAPRHLGRTERALAAARKAGHSAVRVSDHDGSARAARPDVYVLDTHGELTSLYAAADLTLLGGTFAPHGGHNPNEAARYGVPVVTGPFTENIATDLALLDSAGLCYRLEDPGDFPLLAGALEGAGGAAACALLAALLARRPDPSARLAEEVAAELGRDT